MGFPKFHKTYPIAELGCVWIGNSSATYHHGSATENILIGAALGGKDGAFVGALSKTGDETIMTKLNMAICKRKPDQRNFDLPGVCYPENQIERIPLPPNQKFVRFINEVMEAANPIIIKQNTL